MFDVIIIGGGPSGLTAAIYCSRRGLKTLVVSRDIGGQITKTNEIENYPGFDHISGVELSKKFFEQAKKFGAEFIFDEVKEIKKNGESFDVSMRRKTYQTKTIILAFGKKPRELGVPGEEELKGRGVSYCATCDAPFFKNKVLTIVGGGNSALDAAVISSEIAKQVNIIHRGSEFKGEEILINKIKSASNIKIIMNDEIIEITGKERVETVKLKSGQEIPTDGVIVEVGYIIDRSLVSGLVELDKLNQVVTDKSQATSVPGIFASGDLTETPYKQIVISAGEGAKAALSAFDYIQKLSGKKGIAADWH